MHATPVTSQDLGLKPKRGSVNPQPLDAALNPNALLRLKTFGALAGLSEATIYRRAAVDPTFPKLVRLGKRATRIRAGEGMAWLAAQAA